MAIGKPVYHRFTNTSHGNWMRDSLPRTLADGDKYWATKYNETYVLYEYTNKTTFKKDLAVRNYTLPFALKVRILLLQVQNNFVKHGLERQNLAETI